MVVLRCSAVALNFEAFPTRFPWVNVKMTVTAALPMEKFEVTVAASTSRVLTGMGGSQSMP